MPISASPTLPVKKIPVHIKNSQNRILIKGGRVVNHDQAFYADVYIEDGMIRDVGENLIVPGGVKTIEARGKLVVPGGIDADTHLEQVFMGARTADDFATATRAAVAGGTTCVLSSVREHRSVSLSEAVAAARERASTKACCDYSFHACVSSFTDKAAKDMETCVREHGVNSFLVYMTYRELLMLREDELLRVIRRCKELGCVAMVHAESGDLAEECAERVRALGVTGPEGHLLSRPEQLEAEAVQRAISIAEELNCPLYIVNVMSKASALAIANAKRRGVVVYGEALTAGLATDGSHYFNKCWKHAAGHVMAPPLREDPSTPSVLMDLLANGDLELAASSHSAFNVSARALGKDDFARIPHGVTGIEERLSVVWERGVRAGKLDPCRFVAVTSTNAAKLFNMYPRKGRIERGADADVVVWDPELLRTVSPLTHHSSCDSNILDGVQLHGAPLAVVSNGRLLLEEGVLNLIQGSGRYIDRPCFADHVYGRVRIRDGLKPRRVQREPYTGEIADVVASLSGDLKSVAFGAHISPNNPASFHARPLTKAGARNLQDSQFSIGGDWNQIDEGHATGRSRAKNPPGGKSSVVF